MYFLFTDETNVTPTEKEGIKFFAYGGLIVPAQNILKLHEKIELIRWKYDVDPEDEIKFGTYKSPSLDRDSFKKLKEEIINAAAEFDCKFIVYTVLHSIAKQPRNILVKWGLNSVLKSFDSFLKENNSPGVVIVDCLPDRGEYTLIKEKFTKGLLYPKKSKTFRLEKMVVFASSCSNGSHPGTILDIVLGAFRYCINEPVKNESAAKPLMKGVINLVWADRVGKEIQALEKGLIFRPLRATMSKVHQEAYDKLLDRINILLKK